MCSLTLFTTFWRPLPVLALLCGQCTFLCFLSGFSLSPFLSSANFLWRRSQAIHPFIAIFSGTFPSLQLRTWSARVDPGAYCTDCPVISWFKQPGLTSHFLVPSILSIR